MIGLRVLVSLGAVLALLWWLHRRLTAGPRARAASPVSVVAKQGIGAKASIVVIDVEGSRLVLGVTEQSVSVLQSGETPAPAEEFAKSMDAATSGGPAPIELFGRPTFGSALAETFTPAQFARRAGFGFFNPTSQAQSALGSRDRWRDRLSSTAQAATTLRRAR
ncbi:MULTISPECIES: flagellar biosynthetic protein FliO [unclassified Salinibacterium]|uniref:FliO/MopB family protein n=1 Tax=unclassified Salinibacterium TaxID=2632331 RepID=UPI00143DED22|nr:MULTISPECIES: flagellar biosynthetic protein FliO [unclassified Salinibacterium]